MIGNAPLAQSRQADHGFDRADTDEKAELPTSLTFAAVVIADSGTPLPSTTMWSLLPGLARSVGLGPVFSPRSDGPEAGGVGRGARAVDPAGGVEPVEQQGVELVPDAGALPVAQAAPAGHSAAELPGELLPRGCRS
jgi:hypothetical protein